MNLHIYTIHDSKAEAFIVPFFAPNQGTAVRMFTKACNDQKSDFHQFAGDYTLFELGDFDQNTAKFHLHATPVNLGLALTYINQENIHAISNE